MARIFPLRRVIQQVGAGSSWLASVRPALNLSPVVTGTLAKPQITPGVSVAQAPAVLKVPVTPGVGLTQTATTGTVARPAVTPAATVSTVLRDLRTLATPALEIVRVTYDLTHRSGGTSATETETTGAGWTNDANAAGMHDATVASLVGSAIEARGGQLNLPFADFTDKGSLTITSAKLYFYGRCTGVPKIGDNVNYMYWDGTNEVVVATYTGASAAHDAMTSPIVADLMADANWPGTTSAQWAYLNDVEARVYAATPVTSLATFSLDSVEIEVVANTTQIP